MSAETHDPRPLDVRLTQLERSRTRLAWLGGAALCLALFLLLVNLLRVLSPAPDRVEAEIFALRDWRGQLRGTFALSLDGVPAVELLDPGQVVRARVGLTPEGQPFVELLDQAAKARARLSLDGSGTSSLQLGDAEGKLRAGFAVMPDGRPRLALSLDAALPQAVLEVQRERGGRLVLRTPEGETCFEAP
jgi:hypothetical protein